MRNCQYYVVLMLAASFAFASQMLAGEALGETETVRVIQQDVKLHPLGQHHESAAALDVVEGAEATLILTEEGAFISVSTRQLVPGNAYTMWFGIYNEPQNCEGSPCNIADFLERTTETEPDMGYADGLVAGADGTARFSAHIPVGELRQNWFGNGFRNAEDGEIHMVIHDHGPPIPDMATMMLSTYRAGCTTESLHEDFPEISLSDGEPGPNACNLVQVVFFVED